MNKFSSIVLFCFVFAMTISSVSAMSPEINITDIFSEVEGPFGIEYEYVNNSPETIIYSNCNIWSYIAEESVSQYTDVATIGMPYEPTVVDAIFPDSSKVIYEAGSDSNAKLDYGASGLRTFFEFDSSGTSLVEYTIEPGEKVEFIADFTPNPDLVPGSVVAISLECIDSNENIASSGQRNLTFKGTLVDPIFSYSEDITGHTFESFVKNLIDAGVVSGYPDGTFRPDNDVTRGEFAKFIVKGMGVEINANCDSFDDVASDHTFYNEVTSLKCQSIVRGFDNNMYKPDQTITRAEAISITVSTFFKYAETLAPGVVTGIPNTSDIPRFTDVDLNNPHADSIYYGKYYGFINGESDAIFNPDGNLTRGATAKIIANARN